jgi:hypothetical protein
MYKALTLFRIAVGLGFVINLIFALPALFAPRLLEGWADWGVSNTPYWLQNVGILLVIISTMYIPAIQDPFRYLFISYLLVAGRFAAGVLFLTGLLTMDFPSGFRLLAAGDLTLSTVQAVLLYFTLRAGDPKGARQTRAATAG